MTRPIGRQDIFPLGSSIILTGVVLLEHKDQGTMMAGGRTLCSSGAYETWIDVVMDSMHDSDCTIIISDCRGNSKHSGEYLISKVLWLWSNVRGRR